MVLAEKIRDLIADKKQPYAVFKHSRILYDPAKHESAKRRIQLHYRQRNSRNLNHKSSEQRQEI